MPADRVDLSVLGDRKLDRALRRLEIRVQKKIVRAVFREHARKRIRPRIVANLSGSPVGVDTGLLREAFSKAKIRASSRRPQELVRIGVVWPTRDELQIPADAKAYYPTAVEYGHSGAPAYPYLRPAIDRYARLDRARIANALKRRIEGSWPR